MVHYMTDDDYRADAREQYGLGDEIDIDADAVVSRGDDSGAYVAAWVWVADREEM